MNIVENLMKTGLTRNESELYIALCKEGELNGYEAAKITGIPRANTYQALAGLVDKGGAYVIEGSVQRYTAVPVEEYCKNIKVHMEEVLEKIKQDCPVIKEPAEAYITIKGFSNIIDKIKNIIDAAKERVYVSVADSELKYIKEKLESSAERGLKVVVIVSGDIEITGAIVHKIAKSSGQIRVIADSSDVLTGTISGSDDDICLFSKNKPLVELIKDSLKNEIRLAQLDKEGIKIEK
jgi:Predicted transcriptional regulators